MKRKLPVVILALLLAAAGVAAWLAWRERQPPPDPDRLVLYGNVDIRQVSLAFNAADRIVRLAAREGDRVRAGDVLGVVDGTAVRLRIAQADAQIAVQEQVLARLRAGSRAEEIGQARAQVQAAQTEVDLASRQLARARSVHESTAGRLVSPQDLDTALARQRVATSELERARKAAQLVERGPRREDIAQAQAQLEVVRAERALLAYQLEQTELKAPVDAVVRARLLEPGDMASPQRPAYTLALTRPKWVRAYVAELDLGRIRPGMPAQVTIDSQPRRPIAGRVGYIASVAEFTPKTVQTEALRTALVYEIRVEVDDPDDVLRLGMPATVQLALGER